MVDVLLITLAIGFFDLCLAYVRGCERIVASGQDLSEPMVDAAAAARSDQAQAVSS